MLISREEENQKTIQFRTRFHESVLKELDEYCKWAQINSRDYFIEQACIYIFKNSNRWKVFKEENQSGNS